MQKKKKKLRVVRATLSPRVIRGSVRVSFK